MTHPLVFLACALALTLQACKHPLVIQGQGDIVERSSGVRGCTLEEFQSASSKCTENSVLDAAYQVSYEAVPREGWEFAGWSGTACAMHTPENYCEYDVEQVWVDFTNTTWPDTVLPATVATFTKIGSGPVAATGRFEANTDGDWFKVQLKGSTTYKIAVDTLTGNDDISLVITARSDEDRRRSSSDSPSNISQSAATTSNGWREPGYEHTVFTPRLDSEYFFGVTVLSPTEPVDYQIVVTPLDDDFADNIDTTGALNPGGSVNGNIDEHGDNDWFRIDLIGGTTYQFTITSQGTEEPRLRAWSAQDAMIDATTGQPIGGGRFESGKYADESSEQSMVFTPERSSRWYIAAVGDRGEIGAYTLTANAISDDFPDTYVSQGVLAVGGSIGFTIDARDDTDVVSTMLAADTTYQFELDSGEQRPFFTAVSLEDGNGSGGDARPVEGPSLVVMRSEQSGFVFSFDITDPGSFGQSSPSTLTFTTDEGGAYFLKVGDDSDDGPFVKQNFTLSLDTVTDDFPDTAATQGVLTVGVQMAATIDTIDDQDWFRATLNGGVTYKLSAQATIDPSDPLGGGVSFLLLDGFSVEDLAIIGSAEDGVPGRTPLFGLNQLVFTPRLGGKYFFGVENQGGTGDYTVLLQTQADDYADTVDTTGTVAVGGSAAGVLESAGDFDWFRTQVQAGVSYLVKATPGCGGGLFGGKPSLFLHANFGVGSDKLEGTQATQQVLTPEITGESYISVGSGNIQPPCNYSLSVEVIEDDYPADASTDGVLLVPQ